MRIGLVISDLGPGGAQRVLTSLAGAWSARANDVHLLPLHGGPDQDFYAVAPTVHVQHMALPVGRTGAIGKLWRNVGRVCALRRALRALQPDVIVSFIDQSNVVTLLAAAGTKMPVIVSERTDPRQSQSGRMWSLLSRLTYPLARSLVVQTSEIAAYYGSWRLRSVATIPNPVYPPPAPDGAERSDLRTPYVLAVGRLSHEKGIDLLLAAFTDVASRFPDWSLVIVGSGPERQRLEAQALELGISGRCDFLGEVREVATVMKDASLFVLPSRTEGFPNSLCEAMACGITSVATDCPSGPRHIVSDGVDGVLVPTENAQALAQAMSALMADPTTRRRLGDAARTITERFSVSRVLALWDDVLQDATAG